MAIIILASQSPRRRQLLHDMGLVFDVIPSAYEEKLDDSRVPAEVAKELAYGKAQNVAKRYPDAIVIGSDTLVTINGKQLEKPRDINEAREMLTMLSGAAHEVTTAIAVICLATSTEIITTDSTIVYFLPHNDEAIEAYLATGDSMDKAGAYGIQSGAATLISHIIGNYDTVVGLPTALLCTVLRKHFSIDCKPVVVEAPVEQLTD